MFVIGALQATTPPVVKITTSGTPIWATAVVAVGAALLGSLVGGFVSYRANVALEDRRRRGRSQVRRKAKIYTPIRAEMKVLLEELRAGKHFGTWGIMRAAPPALIVRPASLHIWKDLIEDGRADTAASEKVRNLLNEVETCADRFSELRVAAHEVFEREGKLILNGLGHEPRLLNWVDTDAHRLVRRDFAELSVLGLAYGEPIPKRVRKDFEVAWSSSLTVQEQIDGLNAADQKLQAAVLTAITELERAMRRIASRYENESAED